MTDKYKDEYLPKFYDLAAQYYSDVAGPYLLGDKITYADFAIYKSICDDDHFGALPVSDYLFSIFCTPVPPPKHVITHVLNTVTISSPLFQSHSSS